MSQQEWLSKKRIEMRPKTRTGTRNRCGTDQVEPALARVWSEALGAKLRPTPSPPAPPAPEPEPAPELDAEALGGAPELGLSISDS